VRALYRIVVACTAVVAFVACGGSSKTAPSTPHPELLPITAAGANVDAAIAPLVPIQYDAAPDLPSLEGTAYAYRVPPGTWSSGNPDATVSSPPPPHPANFPSQDEARATALDALRAAGTASDGTVTVTDNGSSWSVIVDPVVEGVPTVGFASAVEVGPGPAIVYASAPTGRPERRDEYPLIGTKEALARLNRGEGFVGPQAALAPAADSSASVDSDGAQHVVFTTVERVLLLAPSIDGTDSWLVPGYRFRAADGVTQSVLAVDDAYFAPPPPVPQPVPLPAPQPGSEIPPAPPASDAPGSVGSVGSIGATGPTR